MCIGGIWGLSRGFTVRRDEENQNSIYAAIWKEYMQLLLNFPSSVKPTEIPYRLFAELKSVFC